jgi:hypothetical protein
MNTKWLQLILLVVCCSGAGSLRAQHFIGVVGGYGINTMTSSMRGDDYGTVSSANNYGLVYKYYRGQWVGIQVGLHYAEKGYLRNRRIYNDPEHPETFVLQGLSTRRFQMIEVPFMTQFHYELWKIRAVGNAGLYGACLLSAKSDFFYPDAPENEYERNEFNTFDYGLRFGGGLGLMLHPLEIQFEFNYSVGLAYTYAPDSPLFNFTTYNRLSQMLVSVSVFFVF